MLVLSLALLINVVSACTDFYMSFDHFKLSGRTLDLGSSKNWTITTWPKTEEGSIQQQETDNEHITWPAKYASLGLSANWLGDDRNPLPTFYGDSMNEKGLSCSLLTLINSQYQEKSEDKLNIFNGVLCHYIAQTYSSVYDLQENLPNIAVWGPDALDQHYVVRDASGASLVLEFQGGVQQVYLDINDGESGFGIMTNEPTFDWHVENIKHYEWKRTLARQSVAIPGNFYPDERFLRAHMMRSGMEQQGLMDSTTDFQSAFALTAQVLNTVTVPQGDQYGTDSGEASGEGNADHTVWGLIRNHQEPGIYWRDNYNPTFRRLRMADLDMTKKTSMMMQLGPYFVDMANSMK